MSQGISMIETLRDFVSKVNELGIEYMITGSYAMSAYGEIRMTRDIDVRLRASDLQPFFDSFKHDYYISDISIRRALDQRSMFNIVNNEHGGKIACIIQKDTDFARESFQRRELVEVAGIKFWNTTIEDLIVAKLAWARESKSEMQIRDIANLTDSEYDAIYVDRWVNKIGLIGIWAEVEKWKTQHKQRET